MTLRFASAFAALVVVLPALAWADPSPGEIQVARDLFTSAEKDEDAGNWAAALDKVKRASSVKMTPGLRYHMGLCEEKLGQLAAALNDYSAAEALAKSERNREVLDAVADPLKALRARVPTLSIEVPADVQGVEVTLDGKPFSSGLWGLPTPVDPGSHEVGAHAPGKNGFSATVMLKEREAQKVPVRMTDATKQGTPTPAPAPTPTPTPTPAPAPALAPTPPPTPTGGGVRVGAIVSTVGAVALVGFGVGAYFVADGQQSDAKAHCATETTTPCLANQWQIRTWDALALTSWITGGALAAVAVVLWVLPSHGTASAPAEARLEARPGGLSLAGSF